jgi:hypothetical protein
MKEIFTQKNTLVVDLLEMFDTNTNHITNQELKLVRALLNRLNIEIEEDNDIWITGNPVTFFNLLINVIRNFKE